MKNKKGVQKKQRFRLQGKFVSQTFEKRIRQIATASLKNKGRKRIGEKDILKYLNENQQIFINAYENGTFETLDLSPQTVEKKLLQSKDSIILDNGKERKKISKEEAIYKLYSTEQFLFTNLKAAGMTVRLNIKFDGTIILSLPPNSNSLFEDLDEEETADLLEEYGITAYISEPIKDEEKEKAKEKRRKIKLQFIKQKKKTAYESIKKTKGTKAGKRGVDKSKTKSRKRKK